MPGCCSRKSLRNPTKRSGPIGFHGFLYSNGTYTTLDDPLGTNTEALGINDAGQIVGFYTDSGLRGHGFLLTITPNPAAPAGTTADMILRGSNTSSAVAGQYEIYDIGNNAILPGYSLGQVGTDWAFDMLLRSSTTGGFEIYDIANNNITNAAFLGTVGMNWQVLGFGNFSSMPGETDMLLRNSNTGAPTIRSPTPPSSARSGSIGSSRASPRYTLPAHPTSRCATPAPAPSRSTTSPTIRSPRPRAWDRSDWSGSSAASPPMLRPHRRDQWTAQVRPHSSYKRWRALAVAAAQPTTRIPRRSVPTRRSSCC
jgi:hypothetical protein